jgi:hypothetical protein
MDIDPAEAAPEQLVILNEAKRFFVGDRHGAGQELQQLQHLGPVPELPAGKLPDDERVAENLPVKQQPLQTLMRSAEVVNPYGGVDQHHE